MTPDLLDPVKFARMCWPHIRLYDKQKEILYSVRDNQQTFCVAGNDLGKDFVSALCTIWFFVSRRPARVVTTSVKFDQLNDVLWGEIRRFLDTSKVKLPIDYNHMKIFQTKNTGERVPLCEIVGQVCNKGESLLGRHLPEDIPRTFVLGDEVSGLEDMVYESCDTWAHRMLWIGNPFPCNNFFFKAVKGGDVPSVSGRGLLRKVIRIKATDSPNVRLAEREIREGREPSHTIVVPGVLSYERYLQRRASWDKVRQCIGLDADFYEGAEVLLFPPEWLNGAEEKAASLPKFRHGRTIGVDTAEGGDSSVWSVVDEYGLIKQISMKTPDTSVIPERTLALAREYGVPDEEILFDMGGGGKEHADRLRRRGHNVRTVAFGEPASSSNRFRFRTRTERKEETEVRYVYKNRRAEMYGLIRHLLNRDMNPDGFGLPVEYSELRRQLAPIPLEYDGEGRLVLMSKNVPADSDKMSLTKLLGCSPDEADSLALAVFGMYSKPTAITLRSMA